jgi:hypothetical protein
MVPPDHSEHRKQGMVWVRIANVGKRPVTVEALRLGLSDGGCFPCPTERLPAKLGEAPETSASAYIVLSSLPT